MTSAPSSFGIGQTLPVSKVTRPVGSPKHKFVQFNLDYGRLFTDDYVQKKLLTVKYNGKGNFFSLAAKGTFDFKVGTDKKETPVTSSEVKLITNVEGRNIEARFDSKGVIRLWGNFGTYTISKPLIVTAKVKTTSQFDKVSGALAAEYQGPQFNFFGQFALKNGNIPFFSEKLIFRQDRIQVGIATKLNLSSYNVTRYNAFVAYNEKDFGLVAEHVTVPKKGKTGLDIGKFILAGIYRKAGNDYILKTSYRPHKAEQFRVKLGTVASLNKDTTIRAKINNNAKLTLSSRFRYNSNVVVVAGTQINLLDPSTFVTKRTVPVPVGFQVEFNYA